jgi:probable dihydroxyacetone kinase regulator
MGHNIFMDMLSREVNMLYSGKPYITKKALADSLKELMSVKPINKIGVREVAERCGLNRQTFYYHFHDIYELLEWTIDHDVVNTIKDQDHFLSWQDAGVYLLRYIKKNQPLSVAPVPATANGAFFVFINNFTRQSVIIILITQGKEELSANSLCQQQIALKSVNVFASARESVGQTLRLF